MKILEFLVHVIPLGSGDESGLYYGTQNLNQGQLDRWNIFTTLNF